MKTNRRSFFASVAALFAAKPLLSCIPKATEFAPKHFDTYPLGLPETDYLTPEKVQAFTDRVLADWSRNPYRNQEDYQFYVQLRTARCE